VPPHRLLVGDVGINDNSHLDTFVLLFPYIITNWNSGTQTMSGLGDEVDYSYDGYLVFNGLYTTDILDPDFDFDEIVSDVLVDFERGDPDEPKSGYELLEFGDLVEQSHLLSSDLKETLSDVRGIRHRYEEWETRELRSGEEEPTREVRSFDLYWDYPDYMFVKGDKTQASRASQIVNYELGDYLTSRKIEFNPDFLLWLFYKEKSSETVGDNLDISLLSDAAIEGEEEDMYGKEVSVDRSTDVTKSTNVLSGILRGKDLIGLEGIFNARGNFVKANIQVGGRVHIKVSQDIADVEDLQRMSLALVFLRELLGLYEEWEEKPGSERIPPPEFLEEVYEECKRQGEEPVFSFDHVVEQYRNKRAQGGQGGNNNRQSGLTSYLQDDDQNGS